MLLVGRLIFFSALVIFRVRSYAFACGLSQAAVLLPTTSCVAGTTKRVPPCSAY
jgi:hypothetical protein